MKIIKDLLKQAKNSRRFELRQSKLLPRHAVLEESDSIKYVLSAIVIVSFIILALLIWSSLASINETAVADGEVIPMTHIHKIQHLEGGIVKKIYVKDGQRVKKNELLVALDPTVGKAELRQLLAKLSNLRTDKTRLKAFISEDGKKLKNFSADELKFLSAQISSRAVDRAILEMTTQKAKQSLKNLEAKLKNLTGKIQLVQTEVDLYRSLDDERAYSGVKLLRLQREKNKVEGEIQGTKDEIILAKHSVTEAQYRLLCLDASLRKDSMQEFDKINEEIREVRQSIVKVRDRVRRLYVRAPIAGLVKGMKTTIGSVLPPGGEIAEVVPLDNAFYVEAKILAKDVGHVKVGDKVDIKVTTFDYARYGSIPGKSVKISASTFTEDDEEPYYKGIIHMTRNYVGGKKGLRNVMPGMTVKADIIGGKKSLLNYLLKPIHTTLRSSFHER